MGRERERIEQRQTETEERGSTVELRAVSYNLKVGVDSDPATLGAELCMLQPDLVAIQEVGRGWRMGVPLDQSAYLAAAAGLPYFHFAPALTDERGGQFGIALLSRWPLSDLERVELPRREDEQRVLLRATLQGPTKIRIMTSHLSIVEDERALQFEQLTQIAGRSDEPLLLFGDLNELPDAAAFQGLEAAGLRDAFVEAGSGAGETFSVKRPHRRIDYLLVRGLKTRRCWVERGTRGSDHFPLIADLVHTTSEASIPVIEPPRPLNFPWSLKR